MTELSVIIPTGSEDVALRETVLQVIEKLESVGRECEMIIVAHSDNGDAQKFCSGLETSGSVRVVTHQREAGKSAALIDAMNLADGNILVVTVADEFMSPETIFELVAALDDSQVDFAILSPATRPDTAGFLQRFVLMLVRLLAWPLYKLKDPLTSSFAIRRSTFLSARNLIDPRCFSLGLELIVKCRCRNLVDVPISRDKPHQETIDLGFRQLSNHIRHLRRLYNFRFGGLAYFVQFCVVGFSGMLVDLGLFSILLMSVPTTFARALAIWTAMTWNFLLNRHVTFSFAREQSIWRQYLGYVLSCSLGATLNWAVSVSLFTYVTFFTQHKVLAAVVGVITGTLSNFLLCRLIVFRTVSENDPQELH